MRYLLLKSKMTYEFEQRGAFVSTSGVKAPEEAIVDGITGWAHNVQSSAVHVLNCNTLLIKDFQYTGEGIAGMIL